MTRSYHFVLPGPADTPTGGFVYDRQMCAALQRAGRLAGAIVLPGEFPQPAAATQAAAARALELLADGAAVIVDGLALTPLRELFAPHASRLLLLALIHHPLGDETGLSAADRIAFHDRERQALSLVRGVLVTSAHTAERLATFGVPAGRLRVVRPGVDEPRGGRRRGSWGESRQPSLLCVGSLTRRKGQDVLLHALARLRHLRWHLHLVGPARDRRFAGHLRRLAAGLRLAQRVTFAGAVPAMRLTESYRSADVFVFPSHYEGYGIAAAEAAAHGLPIVASNSGAIAEATEGAWRRLIPPGDPATLAVALRRLLTLPPARRMVARRSGTAASIGSTRWTWARAGRAFISALDEITTGASA